MIARHEGLSDPLKNKRQSRKRGENPLVNLTILRRAILVGVVFELLLVVAVSTANVLGDRPDLYISYGVMVCMLTGAIGGLFGQLDAVIKAFLKKLN